MGKYKGDKDKVVGANQSGSWDAPRIRCHRRFVEGLNTHVSSTVNCGGNPMYQVCASSSRTPLLPNCRPRRDRWLGWPGVGSIHRPVRCSRLYPLRNTGSWASIRAHIQRFWKVFLKTKGLINNKIPVKRRSFEELRSNLPSLLIFESDLGCNLGVARRKNFLKTTAQM